MTRVVEGVGGAASAIKKLTDGKSISDHDIERILEAIAVALGLPYIGPKRAFKAISKQNLRELIGGPPKK